MTNKKKTKMMKRRRIGRKRWQYFFGWMDKCVGDGGGAFCSLKVTKFLHPKILELYKGCCVKYGDLAAFVYSSPNFWQKQNEQV